MRGMTWKHGPSSLRNYGCHCDVCRAGHAESMRLYRQRRKVRRNERIVRGRFVKVDTAAPETQ